MTPNEIYEQIINDSETYEKDWTYIIDGKSGPTGKTWLATKLNEAGYKAIDKSDILPNYPNYGITGNRNIIEFSERYKTVVIILNEIINPLRVPGKLPSSEIKLIPVSLRSEVNPGDWLYDMKMVERKEHVPSIKPKTIKEQKGFVLCDVVNKDLYGKAFLVNGCDGESEWVPFECDRYYKVVFLK